MYIVNILSGEPSGVNVANKTKYENAIHLRGGGISKTGHLLGKRKLARRQTDL